MKESYKHTQVGYAVLALISAIIVLLVLLMVFLAPSWIAIGVLLVLAKSLVFFPTMTVTVDADAVAIRYGPGLIRKRFLLKDIESCRAVRNPWYYGWGLRLTPRGWLYNVSGLGAVELQMLNGRFYRIGTDEPQALETAVSRALGRPGR